MRRVLAACSLLIGAVSLGLVVSPAFGDGPQASEPRRQETTERFPDATVVLDPIPSAYQPGVTADDAIAVAHEEIADFESADSVQPTLALFSNLTLEAAPGVLAFRQVPAWVVTVQGICVPVFGHRFPPDDGGTGAHTTNCAGTEWNVAVDATTGLMLQVFSYR
jgi:hypothetical protein